MRLTRRGRATVTLAVAVVLGALVTALVVRTPLGALLGLSAGPPCRITAGEATYEWSAEQAMTATTVAGVGTRIGATANGVAAAVASSLDPEPERPLTPDAAREVYRALPDVATPDREAVRLAQALLGHDDGVLTCTVALTGSVVDREEPNDLGLTPRADEVRATMRSIYGKQILGGFAPRGVTDGHIDGSAHYEGRALDVFFRPVSAGNQRLGWQQALWARR